MLASSLSSENPTRFQRQALPPTHHTPRLHHPHLSDNPFPCQLSVLVSWSTGSQAQSGTHIRTTNTQHRRTHGHQLPLKTIVGFVCVRTIVLELQIPRTAVAVPAERYQASISTKSLLAVQPVKLQNPYPMNTLHRGRCKLF